MGQSNGPPLLTGWAWGPESSISPLRAEMVTLNDSPYRVVSLPRQPKEQHSKRPAQAKTQTLTGRSPSTKQARAPRVTVVLFSDPSPEGRVVVPLPRALYSCPLLSPLLLFWLKCTFPSWHPPHLCFPQCCSHSVPLNPFTVRKYLAQLTRSSGDSFLPPSVDNVYMIFS